MAVTEDNEAETALTRVEEETGIPAADQLQLLSAQIAFAQDMGGRIMDLAMEREKTKQHLASTELADRESARNYKLASKQINLLEKIMTHHFAERKIIIEEGFRTIDKALTEHNWDAATKVFQDMSAMVAQSPLAAAIALNNKMKTKQAITLDDF